MNWYLKVLSQYADFEGRARRTEYWMFTLVNIIISLSFFMIDNRMGASIFEFDGIAYGYLTLLYSLAVYNRCAAFFSCRYCIFTFSRA